MKPRISASPPPYPSVTMTTMTMVAATRKRSNDVRLGFGFGLGMGNRSGGDTDTSVDSAPRSAHLPRPRVHPRTASRSLNEYVETARIRSCAESSRWQRITAHETSVFNYDDYTEISTSASATMGFRDPLIVCRGENEAYAKAS